LNLFSTKALLLGAILRQQGQAIADQPEGRI